ncbi:HI1506-related protein [Pseudomonas sp. NPDC090201]|uniref:HI1506-related protein n=1 Tax=Pseudomonas sp. NPDC090201 TaxID=3364475 RepID=UPI0037F9B229
MGTVVKAKRDGFRRAGLVHFVAGTFYPDGELSEVQLTVLRADPHLLVVEGVQEDALQVDIEQQTELIQEMGATIAALEHSLAIANDQYDVAAVLLASLRDQQLAAPALIVAEARTLLPADPTAEGVICIAGDALLALIGQHLQPVQVSAEKPDDESDPTSNGPASDPEASQNSTPVAPVSPAPGSDPGVVKAQKPSSKRTHADKKAAGE